LPRQLLALAAVLAVLATPRGVLAFGFADVAQRAATLAAASFQEPDADLPKDIAKLTYDEYRDIRFRMDRALWRDSGSPFEVAFFHRGHFFGPSVRVNEIDQEGVREVAFRHEDFEYGRNVVDRRRLRGIGFAGFRIHYPVNTAKYKDEVAVFLGASYFRALGKDQRYGLSARGLALDTGLSSGEEFPRFTEFWLERPTAAAKELVVYALLDSRSVTGAYRFVIRPGVDTVIDVKARIIARRNVTKIGIAPLTSMFFSGENQRGPNDDYRPEVHDSDGLAIQSGTGEWIWRPLLNPKRLLVTSFALTNPAGFGLQQRDRNFASYEDLEARYELRPGAWVKPVSGFRAGRVELLLIPTPDESNDNVVAFWQPDDPPKPGQAMDVEYQVLWQKNAPTRPPASNVVQTRRGHGYLSKADESIAFHIDFEGPGLKKLTEKAPAVAVFTADPNGELLDSIAHRNDVTGGWRVSLRVRRIDPAKPVELRGFLRVGNETASETWSYILPPA
jgi:periplasmic glucans biosynthesis protein